MEKKAPNSTKNRLHLNFTSIIDIDYYFGNNILYHLCKSVKGVAIGIIPLKSTFSSNTNKQASVDFFLALEKDIKVKSVIMKQRYFGGSTLKDSLTSSILIFQPTSSLLFPLDTEGVRKIWSSNRRLWRPSSSCLRFPRLALIPHLLQNNSCSTKTSNISQFVRLCGNRQYLISEPIFMAPFVCPCIQSHHTELLLLGLTPNCSSSNLTVNKYPVSHVRIPLLVL